MKQYLKYIFLCSVLLYVSCEKFESIPAPKDTLVTSAVFADSADATTAVIGIYTRIMQNTFALNFDNGGLSAYTGLYSDELFTSQTDQSLKQLYVNSVSATSNDEINSFWDNAYMIDLYQINACIEGIAASTGLTNSLRNQLTGECKLLRAMTYFNLVNLFGPVPLVLSTNYQLNAVLARSSTDSIYNQISADLRDASNLLSPNYVTQGRLRPNQAAALALSARVYLYRQNWDSAAIAATKVINYGMYNLEPDLNNVFLGTSNEAIWQMQSSIAGWETAEGYNYVPTDPTIIPSWIINSFLLNAFEPNDQRRVNWLDSNVVNGQAYYYPFKYKLGNDGNSSPLEDYTLLRLGEQYLIRAEAETETGDLGDAATDLNAIRNRAGLPPTTASGQADLLSAILHERQVELFCECGHRWFDLKRTGNVNAVMSVVTPQKGGVWNSNGYQLLLPIPQSQILLNHNLTQNAGY